MEGNAAVDKREQGMILPDADIAAGINLGSALADQNIACGHFLSAITLHAKTAAC